MANYALLFFTSVALASVGCCTKNSAMFIISKNGQDYLIKPTPSADGLVIQEIARREGDDIILHPHSFTVMRLENGKLKQDVNNQVFIDQIK